MDNIHNYSHQLERLNMMMYLILSHFQLLELIGYLTTFRAHVCCVYHNSQAKGPAPGRWTIWTACTLSQNVQWSSLQPMCLKKVQTEIHVPRSLWSKSTTKPWLSPSIYVNRWACPSRPVFIKLLLLIFFFFWLISLQVYNVFILKYTKIE